jgi:uncharacterized protein
MIAIGGGGYVPARILRSFLKQPGSPNIPIQAIGLSLYEQLPSTHPSSHSTPGEVEAPGTKVTRTQWLDLTSLGEMENLVGKRILIVDEVDDTRTTLEYAVRELQKDVEIARQKLGYEGDKTEFSIFVLHVSVTWSGLDYHRILFEYYMLIISQNKDKEKKGRLPDDMLDKNRYIAARTVGDVWICYPWEATDIEAHDAMAVTQSGI